MKQFLLLLIFIASSSVALAQRDSLAVSRQETRDFASVSETPSNLSIYPVPVRDNSFTIKSEKEISLIRITNIIGQDIYMARYNTPLYTTRIVLENPKRGMYVVVITFADNTRIARRILIEGSL
ncbi:MAG: T9SS type A sorting domain-containing protein [Bacteroidales bacterium]